MEWIVTFGSFLVFLPFGPKGIAIAWCATYWLLTIPAMWYAGKPIELGVGQIVGTVWRYVVASLAASFVSYFALRNVPGIETIPGSAGASLRILLVTILFATLYTGAVVLLHGGTQPLRRIIRLLNELRGKGRAPGIELNHPTGGVEAAKV